MLTSHSGGSNIVCGRRCVGLSAGDHGPQSGRRRRHAPRHLPQTRLPRPRLLRLLAARLAAQVSLLAARLAAQVSLLAARLAPQVSLLAALLAPQVPPGWLLR